MRALFNFVARQNFAKKETRSPRGFLPRPLLRAGESEFRTPPPFPQKNEAGCGQEFRSKKVRANAKITPQFKTFQLFRWGQVRMLAAPNGAARKELSQKIPRLGKRKGSGFVQKLMVRSNFLDKCLNVLKIVALRQFFGFLYV